MYHFLLQKVLGEPSQQLFRSLIHELILMWKSSYLRPTVTEPSGTAKSIDVAIVTCQDIV